MDDDRFDTLARALSTVRSRRGLARLLSGCVLAGAAVPALVPRDARADARKRCRKKGGFYARHGQCHCTEPCHGPEEPFACGGSADCTCRRHVSGKGLCTLAGILTDPKCASDRDCPGDTRCIFFADHNCTLGSCKTSADCGGDYGCVNGKCRVAYCATPCAA